VTEWVVPLSDLDYGKEEEEAVLRVLAGKWLSMGPEVQAFEREFREFQKTKFAFAVSNGTAALHLALLALGIKEQDEVIQPALNFVAAANMTVAVGAVPVFADIIDLAEPTIDPASIESLITPRTKCVIVMHYGGFIARMEKIKAICEKYKLALLEDACHAAGAYHFAGEKDTALPPRVIGDAGDIACFSFFANKNLVTGEGGMITTGREDLAQSVKSLRSHGMTSLTFDRHRGHASVYDVLSPGYNYRFDEIRAALGRCQLRKLLLNNQRREKLVSAYKQNLSRLPGWIIPSYEGSAGSSYHLMIVVAPDETKRQQTVKKLQQAGIQTSRHYPRITDLTAYRKYSSPALELSRKFAARAITLPLYPSLPVEQVDKICSIIAGANPARENEIVNSRIKNLEASTVVIAMPVYLSGQQAEKIAKFREALFSIVNQSQSSRFKIKVLVVDDDTPTDQVKNICLEFRQRLELHYLRRRKPAAEAKGPSGALNSALKYLFDLPDGNRTEESLLNDSLREFTHFCFIHADDTLTAESIGARVCEFDRQKNAGTKMGAVYGGLRVYRDSRESVFTYYDLKNSSLLKIYMFLSDYFPDHTMMWERNFLKDIMDHCYAEYKNLGYEPGDFFDTRFSYMEDTDASMTTAQAANIFGYTITAIPEILYNYFDAGSESISEGEFVFGTEAYNNRIFGQSLIPEKQFPGSSKIFRRILKNLKTKNVLIEKWKGDALLKFCDTLVSIFSRKKMN
jgi:dTDP-4-amino-4,6-dideoxygalactose transaminase